MYLNRGRKALPVLKRELTFCLAQLKTCAMTVQIILASEFATESFLFAPQLWIADNVFSMISNSSAENKRYIIIAVARKDNGSKNIGGI